MKRWAAVKTTVLAAEFEDGRCFVVSRDYSGVPASDQQLQQLRRFVDREQQYMPPAGQENDDRLTL